MRHHHSLSGPGDDPGDTLAPVVHDGHPSTRQVAMMRLRARLGREPTTLDIEAELARVEHAPPALKVTL